jgi:hypothetical protein
MRAVIYYLGPKTLWSKKIDEDEIIASRDARSLLAVRWWAQSIHAQLDKTRCGWAIVDDSGAALEHVEALGTAPP